MERLEKLWKVLFEGKQYIKFVASTRGRQYHWDIDRQFFAYYGAHDGEYDYYAIGPDGTWWRGGANIPAVQGWDIEKYAKLANV